MAGIAIAQQPRTVDDVMLRNSEKTGEEWLTNGLNYGETRYSPLKQIDGSNVSRLGLAWSYEIGPGGGTQESTRLVSNGCLRHATAGNGLVRNSALSPPDSPSLGRGQHHRGFTTLVRIWWSSQ